jgi:hypothetical protein
VLLDALAAFREPRPLAEINADIVKAYEKRDEAWRVQPRNAWACRIAEGRLKRLYGEKRRRLALDGRPDEMPFYGHSASFLSPHTVRVRRTSADDEIRASRRRWEARLQEML